MTQKVISFNVNTFTSHEKIAKLLNDALADKNVRGVFFNATSLINGAFEILVDNAKPEIIFMEKPSKFKQNASSRFYCVYKKGNGWTYKFVNKKISKKPFLGKMFDDELDAAWAYDKHRFSVEGDLSKLNFPEHFMEVE